MYSINTIISSLTQSLYDGVDNLLKEYQQVNPSFKYELRFGSNYDEYTDKDVFNIVMQVGTINRLPAHYTNVELDGHSIPYLPFAGTVDVALSILNPVAVHYTDEIPLNQIQDSQIDYNLDNQSPENHGHL